jgi:hypothetical protein
LLEHFAARTEERRAGRDRPAQGQQAVFVAAGAVQQQQYGRALSGGRLKTMLET